MGKTVKEEPAQDENGQPIISIEEWRPKEPAQVEKDKAAVKGRRPVAENQQAEEGGRG